jgi:hypothetical protein
MDGNNAFLYSESWLNGRNPKDVFANDNYIGSGKSGMLIDLKRGHIDAYNFKLTSGNFILSNSHINLNTIT